MLRSAGWWQTIFLRGADKDTVDSQGQVIYKFLATWIYKFIGWRAGGCHFEEVGLVNLGVSSGELSFSKSYMVDKRGHHDVGLAMLMN